ncbi:MAG TPA: Ig-like domain-containing protein [bacterium]|nr:Ig-like domain-containing protein [bacterium]
MNLPRVLKKSFRLLAGALALGGASCGSFTADGGIPGQALILVTDNAGNPVAGATVWVPADSGDEVAIDTSGQGCEPAPPPVLFASCTGEDGIALLQCAEGATFLFQYAKEGAEGMISGECGNGDILPAPLNP